jgi:hypothetical protein
MYKTCRKGLHQYESPGRCPECRRLSNWRFEQKESRKNRKKQQYQINKEAIRLKNQKYYLQNREIIKARCQAYKKRLRESKDLKIQIDSREQRKRWKVLNKEKVRSAYRRYINKRILNDPFFKFKCRIRSLISQRIRRRGYTKQSRTHELLGASYEVVFEHLKATAIKNYGSYDPNIHYHIDHIVPVSSAKTEEELIRLQHYKNLQYLTPEDNIRKSNR